MHPLPASPAELKPFVHKALRQWHKLGERSADTLSALLIVKDRLPKTGASPEALRLATNEVLLEGIKELAKYDANGATILKRFPDNEITQTLAYRLNMGVDKVNHIQSQAIDTLAEILFAWEIKIRKEHIQLLEAGLPSRPYTQLFGFKAARKTLVEKLLDPAGPPLINVTGMGGIGKTSLADAAVREALQTFEFERAIWIRVEAQTLQGTHASVERLYDALMAELWRQLAPGEKTSPDPEKQIRHALQTVKHLLVFDNLEEEGEIVYLLERLQTVVGRGKCVLTSRAHPIHASHPSRSLEVFTFPVEELAFSDAAELIRHEAAAKGIKDLAAAPLEDLQPIYDLTGGNPLAIKLVVSLLARYPLSKISHDLTHLQPGQVDDLYRHIYRQTWMSLSPAAKALLQAMPLVAATGGLPDQLQTISGLAEGPFWAAIAELESCSLLEVSGPFNARRYNIHTLTRTFLMTEINRWPDDAA